MLRFHLDESVSSAVAAGCPSRNRRHHQHGFGTATGQGRSSARICQVARTEYWSLRTLISGVDAAGASHSGIAYCHPRARTIGQIIRALETMNALLEPEQMIGRVQFI